MIHFNVSYSHLEIVIRCDVNLFVTINGFAASLKHSGNSSSIELIIKECSLWTHLRIKNSTLRNVFDFKRKMFKCFKLAQLSTIPVHCSKKLRKLISWFITVSKRFFWSIIIVESLERISTSLSTERNSNIHLRLPSFHFYSFLRMKKNCLKRQKNARTFKI